MDQNVLPLAPATRSRQVPNGGRAYLLLVAIACLAGWLAACTSPTTVDQAAATQIARDFMASGHGSAAVVKDITVISITPVTDAARPAWKVNVSANVTAGAGTYVSAE